MEGNTKVIKKKINYVRLITLGVIFSYVYIVLNYNFFISENLVNIVLYTFGVFFVGMFFMLDFKNLSKKLKLVYWLGILLIGIIFLIIGGLEPFEILAFVIFNIGIFMFYLSLEYFSFSAWNYFLGSGYVFSIFFAISASIFLVGKYQGLNIKCQDINQYIDQIMGVIISPFDMGYHGSAILALDYNIDDIRAATQTTIENTKQIVKGGNNIIGDIKNPNNIIGGSIGNLTNKVENSEVISNLKGQVGELTTQAQEVLENVNENKNLLSLYYCNKILESLDTVSQGARIITIIVFTLLFWSVIRLVVYIFGVLAYILFKILELLSIYKTRKIKKDAKEIV